MNLSQSSSDLYQAVIWVTVGIAILWMMRHLKTHTFARQSPKECRSDSAKRSVISETLAEALPKNVHFRGDATFNESVGSYWGMQQREIVPECVVKPQNVEEVSIAIAILKKGYDNKVNGGSLPTPFAIRSGGHSTVPGAANAIQGIVIDLRSLNRVALSPDGSSTIIGTGARWLDVSKALDEKGLAVAGGRNSDVGVGGLILGGGISFFSPRVGFVCSNILSYEIVLANGNITTASETCNPDLWRALKGGSNNFCVITSFRARTFPSTDIWSGFLYMTSSKASQLIDAFHAFTNVDPEKQDEYAAGPIMCFTYVQPIRMQILSTNLVYTKPEAWPACWREFQSIRRIWSTHKIQSLTSATNEFVKHSPSGLRQLHHTTTVKNDLKTLIAIHSIYKSRIDIARRIKGMTWTLVFQPLLPTMTKKGQPNMLGLRERNESLVIVLFIVCWKQSEDDSLVNNTTREAMEEINSYAASKGTGDRFRYLNELAFGEDPFAGYGPDNKQILQHVSQAYDPDGLFQQACSGGFKLGL